jgi:hypothetical protein
MGKKSRTKKPVKEARSKKKSRTKKKLMEEPVLVREKSGAGALTGLLREQGSGTE